MSTNDKPEALRQSQSLPAGAVASTEGEPLTMGDTWVSAAEVFRIAGGDVECSPNPSAKMAMDCLRDLRECYDEALQADAREKGGSASLNQIPTPCAYPPVDSETGADTGSCCHHAYADGWNECRAEAIRLATQPAQASEKDNG